MKEIFLIHDEQDGPVARQSFLEMAGYKVTLMQSGERCLELLEEAKPALILMDVLLHGRNGFQVCRDIRGLCTAEELPIILCSELYRGRVFRDEAMAAGAQRYLLKPLKLDQLVGHVNNLTGSGATLFGGSIDAA